VERIQSQARSKSAPAASLCQKTLPELFKAVEQALCCTFGVVQLVLRLALYFCGVQSVCCSCYSCYLAASAPAVCLSGHCEKPERLPSCPECKEDIETVEKRLHESNELLSQGEFRRYGHALAAP